MANIAVQAFRNMLMDALQLAAGCALLLAAGILARRGVKPQVSGRKGTLLTICACSAAGMLLPVGSFGILPAAAALWLMGLELPFAAALIVSNFLFSLYMPITYAVFLWSDNVVRIALAFLSGILAGLVCSHSGRTARDAFRKGAFDKLFEGQRGKTNYLLILKDYVESAGLFIVAAAVLRAALSAGALYAMQGKFLTSGFGFTVSAALSRLNVFSPFFGTTMDVLGRLVDFSAIAALLLLLRFKTFCKLYLYYFAVALLLSVSLFIK